MHVREGLINLSRMPVAANLLKCRHFYILMISDSSCCMPVLKLVQKASQEKQLKLYAWKKEAKLYYIIHTIAGDFNLNFNMQEGEDFVKALRVKDLELRTNPKHYMTRLFKHLQ